MINSTLIQEDLCKVAIDASVALMCLRRGDEFELDDIKQGYKLLQLLERVHEASKKSPEGRTPDEADEHQAVRRCFFVERVPYLAPGWQEWNAAIAQAFRSVLDALIEKLRASRARSIMASILENAGEGGPDQINEMREVFAQLSLLLSEPH